SILLSAHRWYKTKRDVNTPATCQILLTLQLFTHLHSLPLISVFPSEKHKIPLSGGLYKSSYVLLRIITIHEARGGVTDQKDRSPASRQGVTTESLRLTDRN